MAENKKEKLIYELNGLNTFLKIKPSALAIDKVLFAFVQYDKNTSKMLHAIDIYMSTNDALTLAHNILSENFFLDADNSYSEDEQYPNPFWQSKLGGVSEEKAKAKNLRNDGKAISRCFNISVGALGQSGKRNPFVFTALQKAGHTNKNGLIVPETGLKAEITIRVPVMDKNDLIAMAMQIQAHITAWYAAQYTKEN